MMLALVLALMLAAAIFAVLLPLARTRLAVPAGSDVAVYRDQLDEIGRDRASGTIGVVEAEAARVEVSRRLIAAADAAAKTAPPSPARVVHRRVTAVAALALMPLCAGALYLLLGSPNLPGAPLAGRMTASPEQQSIVAMIARVEAHLESNPDDGRGWEVIEPVYLRLGRYDDAVRAQRNIMRLLGENSKRQSDLGEALMSAANGVVTDEAKAAFERAFALDDKDPRAQFYLGLAAEQDGRRDDAAKFWRALIAQGPPEAAWLPVVRDALARLDHPVASGPTPDDIAAASEMSPADRDSMVRGMVERLAQHLQQDGSDVEGWLKLMRAYMVLGDRDKARAALGDARKALAGDPDKLRRIDDSAREIGLEG